MLTLEKAANILIVDDASDNLQPIAKILGSQDYVVRKALNGKMALQAIQQEPPDLILLNINIPDISSYGVYQQLKDSESSRYIPVIFINALDQVNDRARACGFGEQECITKPFQEQKVLARIKYQLLIQQQQKQLLEQQRILVRQNQQLQQKIQERQSVEAEVRRLNINFARQVQIRTLELQQSLRFERTLKRISDKVRDSLDPHQVLQNAVEELAMALEVECCNAALYSPHRQSSLIHYQYLAPGLDETPDQLLYTIEAPEICSQLEQQLFFAFCQVQPQPSCIHSAILACPIFDDQVDQVGILGDLWIFKNTHSSFSEMEIHLVQQVANQCAIALRQARLYEAAQAQVKELRRLNQLKDDFLNTVSHELRTPVANMKLVIQLLSALNNQRRNLVEEMSKSPAQDGRVVQYLKVLQEECDRELALIEDLLNLQQIEAGAYISQPVPVHLQDLLLHLIEPFETRMQNQQQTFEVNIASNLPTLALDVFSFNRIITELLSNACKYTPAGETISVVATITQEATATQPIHSLHLTITNTGVEIAPEEMVHIFDKFYRIPNNDPWKHGGTGLGLALVKKLVEYMGGTITATSQTQTTCFNLYLPLIHAF